MGTLEASNHIPDPDLVRVHRVWSAIDLLGVETKQIGMRRRSSTSEWHTILAHYFFVKDTYQPLDLPTTRQTEVLVSFNMG